MTYGKPKQLAHLALAGCAALACAAAQGDEAPPSVPNDQSKPALLVCSREDSGLPSVVKRLRVFTDGYWSIKGYGEDSYGKGEWVAAYEMQMQEMQSEAGFFQGWNKDFPNARWISVGRAVYDPPISTVNPYLFARVLRIGKLVAGTKVKSWNDMSMYRVDNCVHSIAVLTGDDAKDASVDIDGACLPDKAHSYATRTLIDDVVTGANWKGGDAPGELADNWIIFQVKNTENAHALQTPIGLTAAVSVEATLDCTCPNDNEEVQNGEGRCVPKDDYKYEPQSKPEMLVCYPADTGMDKVERTKRVMTDGNWSVKGFDENSAGAGAWIAAHVAREDEYSTRGWVQFDNTRWISPGDASSQPPIDTTNAYLFARALRVGKLVEGATVQADAGEKYGRGSPFKVDGRVNGFWVTTDAKNASVDTDLYGTTRGSGNNYASASGVGIASTTINAWTWTGSADNWIIFQVQNVGGNTHTTANPTGLTAAVSVRADLDCTCGGNQVQNGEGACVCPSDKECECPAGQAVNTDVDACREICSVGENIVSSECVCAAPMVNDGGVCKPACIPGQSVRDTCAPGELVEDDGVWKPACIAGQSVEALCAPGDLVDIAGVWRRKPDSVCAAPSGCSSAPAAGWSALLGLGAALPLLTRRRRRK